jgi:hypothetical protein
MQLEEGEVVPVDLTCAPPTLNIVYCSFVGVDVVQYKHISTVGREADVIEEADRVRRLASVGHETSVGFVSPRAVGDRATKRACAEVTR